MKKILLFIVISLVFISCIMTLNYGTTYVFSFEGLLNVMNNCPKIDISFIPNLYRDFSASFLLDIPFIGEALGWVVNIGHSLLTICSMIVQALVMVCYLIGQIFVPV